MYLCWQSNVIFSEAKKLKSVIVSPSIWHEVMGPDAMIRVLEIHISQEASQVGWYSHLFKNFPQFVVIYTVIGFGIVKKAEIDVFRELSCFFQDPANVGNLISGSFPFLKPA